MEFLEYQLLNIQWVLLFWIIYVVLFVIYKYRDNKNAGKIINALKQAKSEEEFCQKVNSYLKKYPLSLYNSVLRLKMIPHLLAIDDKQTIKEAVSKIRIVDLYQQLTENIIYVIFLLKENDYKDEFNALLSAASKVLQKEHKDWELFFKSDCCDLTLLKDKYSNIYLESVRCFYEAKLNVDNEDLETTKKCLSEHSKEIADKALYKLLVKNGYAI